MARVSKNALVHWFGSSDEEEDLYVPICRYGWDDGTEGDADNVTDEVADDEADEVTGDEAEDVDANLSLPLKMPGSVSISRIDADYFDSYI